MSRPRTPAQPVLRRHKSTGHGWARFNGQQLWFGRYDDPDTHDRFAAFLARWIANGRQLPDPEAGNAPLTVGELVALYRNHAKDYYRRADGSPTQEVAAIDHAVRPLLDRYSDLPADRFDLRRLKEVREAMIASGLARTTVNIRLSKVVRLFAWGAEEEHIPAEVVGALRVLRPLKKVCPSRKHLPDRIRSAG